MSMFHALTTIPLQVGSSGGGGGDAAIGAGSMLFSVVLTGLLLICGWIIFSKAGVPGWQVIIPIWSTIVLLRIVGRPWWWLLLLFIPILNIIISLIVALDLGKSFGYGAAFSIFLLFLLPFIGALILAFGGSRYLGPGGTAPAGGIQPSGAPA